MKFAKFALVALAAIGLAPFLTGCASVMCGSSQAVSIDSRPRGADVLVYDAKCQVIYKDKTPCIAHLKRIAGDSKKGTYIVVLNKEGFDSVQVPLMGRVNDVYYLNFLTAGVGFLIDPVTGAMWGLGAERPDGFSVKDNASFFDHDGLFVAMEERPASEFLGPKKPAPVPAKPAADHQTIQASAE